MRKIILLLIVLTSCGPVNIGAKKFEIQTKEIKGYEIQYHAERDKYGYNCNVYLTANRKNSDINELYIEIKAIDKDQSILSVAYFFLKDLKNNEIIKKVKIFKDIKSCAKIENLEILGG